jgi:hypothetical protein
MIDFLVSVFVAIIFKWLFLWVFSAEERRLGKAHLANVGDLLIGTRDRRIPGRLLLSESPESIKERICPIHAKTHETGGPLLRRVRQAAPII